MYQIFRTNKAPVDIERLCRDFITTRINSLELEHIAELVFSIALNRKLRMDVPFHLLTKRMKDVGVKKLSMNHLRKLLYGLRTISIKKTAKSLNVNQKEKLEYLAVVVPLVYAFSGTFTSKAVGSALFGLNGLAHIF